MMQYVNEAELHLGWARGRLDDPTAGAAEIRRVLRGLRDQGVRVNLGLFNGLLARARGGNAGERTARCARIDEALAPLGPGRTSLARSPSCIACAAKSCSNATRPIPLPPRKRSGPRSPSRRSKAHAVLDLQAALALAKLYQSTGRPADAHAVLAPALEGFAPTPEMPEIAEAQALLAALAETDEVRAEAAQRRRLTQLHVAYGNALFAARGYGGAGNDGSLRQSPRVGVWRQGRARTIGGRLGLMGRQLHARRACHRCGRTLRPSSATSRRDPIRPRPASPIAPPGSLAGSPASTRKRGITSKGRSPCSSPVATTIWPFASDMTPASPRWPILAIASWPLGEVDRAISLIDRMQSRIADLTHVGTLARGRMLRGHVRIDARRPRARRAERLRTRPPRARARPDHVGRVRRVSRGLGDRCERRARPAGSRTCAAASSCCANRTF